MKKYILITLLILCYSFVFAQDAEPMEEETPAISFSGSVDAYFRSAKEAPGTSFANLPGFSLGMANLVGSYEGSKVGFVADLVFGPRGEDATFLSPELRPGGSSNIVNQLYAYLNVTDKITFTLGNFNTFLGYEVIQPTANFNYSTSYMFSYGPFSHTGLKMDADLGGGLSLMLGILNPTDATEYNPLNAEGSNDYFGGAQLGYSFDAGSAYVNALFGPDYFQVDLTAGFDLTEAIYVGVNATTASDDLFAGVAGYLQFATSDAFKIGARVESFSDKGVGVIAPDESVLSFTLSANYTVDNLTLIPEFRIDNASADVFDGGTSGSLSSFVLAAVYGF